MTKRTIAAASVLILLLLGAILYRPTDRSISKVLGSREYVRIISKADRVDLYQTARFLAMLTNGPPADSHAKVAPGTNVPPQIWSHMSAILLNPQTYSENQDLWGGTASMAPELILTVSSAGATIDIGLADDLK